MLAFQRKLMKERLWETQRCANIIWEEMTNEVLDESKGFGPKDKESWWWNENVQEKIKYKRQCFNAGMRMYKKRLNIKDSVLMLYNLVTTWNIERNIGQPGRKQRRQLAKLNLKHLRDFIKHQKLRMENDKYIRLLK